jgi:nickel/cobalt transporter (NiCoT) family protein
MAMISQIRRMVRDEPGSVRGRVSAMYLGLAVFNLGAWAWALAAFRGHAALMATALLAYSLGLRHAVDADHIAAIDNVTRKLMQQGKRPVGVGLMFSLGHSTVVVVGSMAMAAAALGLAHRMDWVRATGAVVGTAVSSGFLLAIAAVNLVVLRGVWRTFVRVRSGGAYVEEDLDLLLGGGGLLARIFRPMFRMINRSWQMYPLGLLFGLGFDTATEIGVLGIAAAEASKGLPMAAILVFPMLFTAGMSLVDTTDNVLMVGAYGWASVQPMRKLYYNLTVTAISAAVALAVGGVEALGLVPARGAFWNAVRAVNANLGLVGYGIIALFVAVWAAAAGIYKWRRMDALEPEQIES